MKYKIIENNKIINTENNIEIRMNNKEKKIVTNVCNNLNYFANLKDFVNEIEILERIKIFNY